MLYYQCNTTPPVLQIVLSMLQDSTSSVDWIISATWFHQFWWLYYQCCKPSPVLQPFQWTIFSVGLNWLISLWSIAAQGPLTGESSFANCLWLGSLVVSLSILAWTGKLPHGFQLVASIDDMTPLRGEERRVKCVLVKQCSLHYIFVYLQFVSTTTMYKSWISWTAETEVFELVFSLWRKQFQRKRLSNFRVRKNKHKASNAGWRSALTYVSQHQQRIRWRWWDWHILCYETPGNTRGLCEVVNFGGTTSFSNSISLGFHGITVKLGRIWDLQKSVSDFSVVFLVCQIFTFLTMTSGKIILRRGWYLKTQRIKDSHKLCTLLYDFNMLLTYVL